MRKFLKPGRRYFIINVDEPYAKKIYKILKNGQQKKKEWPEGNINFEQWKKTTFPIPTVKDDETVEDIIQELCDKIGVWAGKSYIDSNGDRIHPDDCNCRQCYENDIDRRMYEAIERSKS